MDAENGAVAAPAAGVIPAAAEEFSVLATPEKLAAAWASGLAPWATARRLDGFKEGR
jgi:hypothetical protein